MWSYMKKTENFINCLNVLKTADFELAKENEIYRMGVIGQFDLTFELGWKALKEVMRLHGVNDAQTGSPREVLMLGSKIGFIDDPAVWLLMLKKRNMFSHIYDSSELDETLLLIKNSFIPAFETMGSTLFKKLAEAEES